MPSLYAYTSTASAPLVEHEYKNFDEGILLTDSWCAFLAETRRLLIHRRDERAAE